MMTVVNILIIVFFLSFCVTLGAKGFSKLSRVYSLCLFLIAALIGLTSWANGTIHTKIINLAIRFGIFVILYMVVFIFAKLVNRAQQDTVDKTMLVDRLVGIILAFIESALVISGFLWLCQAILPEAVWSLIYQSMNKIWLLSFLYKHNLFALLFVIS